MPDKEPKSSFVASYAEIDQDHTRLLALIHEMHDALETGCSHAAANDILTRARAELHLHFAREEELSLLTNYPNASAHRAEHRQMITTFDEIYRDFKERSTAALPMQVVQHFKYRFDEHTKIWDNTLAEHLKANPVPL